jgi:hypothetical protein
MIMFYMLAGPAPGAPRTRTRAPARCTRRSAAAGTARSGSELVVMFVTAAGQAALRSSGGSLQKAGSTPASADRCSSHRTRKAPPDAVMNRRGRPPLTAVRLWPLADCALPRRSRRAPRRRAAATPHSERCCGIPARRARTSVSRYRRWPPSVRIDVSFPALAHLVTVFGSTLNIVATSAGVSSGSASGVRADILTASPPGPVLRSLLHFFLLFVASDEACLGCPI